MQIDITTKQAQIIQELIIATGITPQSVGQAIDLYNKCQGVIDDAEKAQTTDAERRATVDAPVRPLAEEV